MHLADAFIQSDLQCIQVIIVSMCVPWELNPQPFALLTQCSTTEPRESLLIYIYTEVGGNKLHLLRYIYLSTFFGVTYF